MRQGTDATEIYRPSPDVVFRNIAGEHLLVPVRTGLAHIDYLYTTDEVGSFILSLLDGRRDVADVSRQVSAEFEVDEDRARADVAAYLSDLREVGLVLLDSAS
ncbi:MAG TPA: PqqD family protein [Candidatus Cryosericum sp.]|nr:PqqD family protein [Candidatus Cryosericum sp.]